MKSTYKKSKISMFVYLENYEFRQTLKSKFVFFYKVYYAVQILIHNALFLINPKLTANYGFRKVFKRNINWNNPSNIIEKIIWMQFNTDTSNWSLCADKFCVREYLKKRDCGDLLVQLYACYKTEKEINFDELPRKFVLKTNNAAGTVLLVHDKNDLNISHTRKKLRNWLKLKYGKINAQLHYLKISPLIIIEKLLENKDSSPLIDYKFYCFSGVPEAILVVP